MIKTKDTINTIESLAIITANAKLRIANMLKRSNNKELINIADSLIIESNNFILIDSIKN